MILPVMALAIRHLAINARVMRASMLEVSFEDYVVWRAPRASATTKSSSSHMVPNALLPVVTIIGLDVQFCLHRRTVGGDSLRMARYRQTDVRIDLAPRLSGSDGEFAITTVLVVVVNLIVDVIYAWLDPRVKYGE